MNTDPGPARAGDLHYAGLAALREALHAGRLSAVELVGSVIARIEARDGDINAVVVRDFERALEAARAADRALAAGDRRPLLGIPVTVKESYNVAGLPTTWGMPLGRDWRPTQDAVLVGRLKTAGAIVVGKTNVPFALGDWQSYNDLYGTTRNPWDGDRSPGGSSGGSAAALAAGYVPLELGSDIGGSLRVPAHFCGVFAHKPSQGLLPMRGHTPPGTPDSPRDVDLAVVGPMARSAADLGELFELLALPDQPLATAYQLALPPPRQTRLKDFRVLVLTEFPEIPTDRETQDSLMALAGRLAGHGASVAHESPLLPDLRRSMRSYLSLLGAFMGADMPPQTYAALQREAAQLPADDHSLAATRLRSFTLGHREWVAADRQRGAIIERWRALFEQFDVVLAPVSPSPAFAHDHTPFGARRLAINGQPMDYGDQVAWPGLATLPGLPATAMPMTRSMAGLPIGLQIVGPFLEDRTPLAFAQALEAAEGGFVPPPGFG